MLFCCIQLILRMDTSEMAISHCCCHIKNFKKVRGTFYLLWREPNGLWTFVCRWLWIVFSVLSLCFAVSAVSASDQVFSRSTTFTHIFGMWQYAIIVPFVHNNGKLEQPFLLYRSHPRLKETDGQCRNDSSLNKTIRKQFVTKWNDSQPFVVE